MTSDRLRRCFISAISIAKNLSQKEVTVNAKLDTAQYSRIEGGKTDPSVNTLNVLPKPLECLYPIYLLLLKNSKK
jgi:transcriptional regulator with XRE-family HTH domain